MQEGLQETSKRVALLEGDCSAHYPNVFRIPFVCFVQEGLQEAAKRVALLESELRAAKRRETKLAATHFRLRQDIAGAGGDLRWVSRAWIRVC